MNPWDEQFYREPSEFEQEIDQFKQSLLAAVKTEFLTEMEQLRKENAELQIIKKGMDKIKIDYRNMENKLEHDRKEMERNIRRERLSELMKDNEILLFTAHSKSERLPKCDKCNERRQVIYTTPMGRTAEEHCECFKSKNVYAVKEHLRTEFRYNSHSHSLTVWYKPYKDDSDTYCSGQVPETIFQEGMSYEELGSHYRSFFTTEEQCQNYCDWLNAKEVFE